MSSAFLHEVSSLVLHLYPDVIPEEPRSPYFHFNINVRFYILGRDTGHSLILFLLSSYRNTRLNLNLSSVLNFSRKENRLCCKNA